MTADRLFAQARVKARQQEEAMRKEKEQQQLAEQQAKADSKPAPALGGTKIK